MNSNQIAQLAIESWRASGRRTTIRLEGLVNFYGRSYFGAPDTWRTDDRSIVERAHAIAQARTHAWEVIS